MAPGASFHFRAWQHTVGAGRIRALAHIASMAQLKVHLGEALAGLGLEYAVHERGCSAEEALAATVGCAASDLDSGRYVLFTIEWDYLESYATSGLNCARDGTDGLEATGPDGLAATGPDGFEAMGGPDVLEATGGKSPATVHQDLD